MGGIPPYSRFLWQWFVMIKNNIRCHEKNRCKKYCKHYLHKIFRMTMNEKSKGRLQKKKVTNLGHCPNRGGGGPTPWIECPNLLKWYEPKIEPNLLGNPESPNLRKSSQNFHLRMSQVQRGVEGVAELGTISQVLLPPAPSLNLGHP